MRLCARRQLWHPLDARDRPQSAGPAAGPLGAPRPRRSAAFRSAPAVLRERAARRARDRRAADRSKGARLMQLVAAPTAIDRAVAGLDAWLESMRGPGGYGGPVVHWWQQSLIYTGAGLDW